MTEEIIEFLRLAHSEKRTLLLHEVIWTIDAQHHEIPTAEEFNEALSESDPFQIERNKNGIHLIPSSDNKSGLITDDDISVSMKIYAQEN
jgi:hypothetical protein